jgi:flagellar protein FliO/FliZ
MKRLLAAAPAAATALLVQAQTALATPSGSTEKQPLDLPLDQVNKTSTAGQSNGSLTRTLLGLFVVIGVIYGLYWILKQVKKSREEQAHGQGLHSLATLPLGPNRSLHMIRAGREIVLVGVAEHGVAPIRSYTEEEAYEAGLIGDPEPSNDDQNSANGNGGAPFATPGAAVKTALQNLRQKTVRK